MRKTGKIRKDRALMLILGLVLVALTVFVIKKVKMPFSVKDTLSRAFLSAKFEICNIKTQSFETAELKSNPKITFEQSGMLINLENRLAEDFIPEIVEYKTTGVYMNKPMAKAYASLSAKTIEEFDEKLLVISHYRTAEEQQQAILEEGENATQVGASEHQAGLALDVYVKNFGGMNFLNSRVGQWVNSNCWQYGFIIRYTYHTPNADGIAYEPWHIRYIGKPHAEIIYKNSLTLEGYFEMLSDGEWRSFGGYLVSRQKGETIELPLEFESAIISPDNTGGYLVCVT